jgi:hypothetical protein
MKCFGSTTLAPRWLGKELRPRLEMRFAPKKNYHRQGPKNQKFIGRKKTLFKKMNLFRQGQQQCSDMVGSGSDPPKGAHYQSEKVIFSHQHFQYGPYFSFSANHKKHQNFWSYLLKTSIFKLDCNIFAMKDLG